MRSGKPPLVVHVLLTAILWAGCAFLPAAHAEETSLRDAWDVTIGAGARATPDYEGSRHYQLEPVPYLDMTWHDVNGRERTFISSDDGVGISLLSTDRWKVGPYLDWRRGRTQSASGTLRGLGESDGEVQWGGYIRYTPHDCCEVFLRARRDFGDDHGIFADIGAELTAPIAASHWFAGVKLWATWANRSGLQALFGITPEQSQATGLRTYSPSAGVKNVTIEPNLTYQFTDHWAAQTFVTYERLLGGAADSPLVATRGSADQLSVGAVVIYHF